MLKGARKEPWLNFWVLVSAASAIAMWFLPLPFGPVSSGVFASIVVLNIVAQLLGKATMLDITKIIVKAGGLRLIVSAIALIFLISLTVTDYAVSQGSSPILLFLLSVWSASLLWLILLAYPFAFHWEEWSRKAREELDTKNKLE